ncbi:MAG: hypothetical protein Q9159_000774 [Coniocarpon cinnabarinum]
MLKPDLYTLPPTPLIPNSPHPLIHYRSFFPGDKVPNPTEIHDILTSNGWHTQWIIRYGPMQPSHYHSSTHECMTVLSGTATIRFGVADKQISEDEQQREGKEEAGIELQATAGDVFIVPAGVAHKTFNAKPTSALEVLTPGSGHGIPAENTRTVLSHVKLSGFTMLGAYPENGVCDFAQGGEHIGTARDCVVIGTE